MPVAACQGTVSGLIIADHRSISVFKVDTARLSEFTIERHLPFLEARSNTRNTYEYVR